MMMLLLSMMMMMMVVVVVVTMASSLSAADPNLKVSPDTFTRVLLLLMLLLDRRARGSGARPRSEFCTSIDSPASPPTAEHGSSLLTTGRNFFVT